MKQIQSVRARMGGNPTLRNRRITVAHMLCEMAEGRSIEEIAGDCEIRPRALKDMLRDIADNIYDWMRPKELWELWELWKTEDDGLTFAPAYKIGELMNLGVLDHTSKCIWSIMADSYIDAMTKYHEYMEWEPYKPMLDENGEPYPEDLGDTL